MGHQNNHGAQFRNPKVWNGLQIGTLVMAQVTSLTLDDDSPPGIAYDPAGGGAKLIMPLASALNEGYVFFVANTADAAEDVTVKDSTDAVTIGTISQNETAILFNLGGVWRICIGKTT